MRILVIEDNPKMSVALQKGLREHGFAADASESGIDGEEMAATGVYDLLILDLMLPDIDGAAATQAILRQNRMARVLVLTSDESEAAGISAVRAGALGFIRKHASIDELVNTIHCVAADQLVIPRALAGALALTPTPDAGGEQRALLTPREREVLQYLAAGYSNQAISSAIGISVDTVRSHVGHLLPKLGATNRTQAAVNAVNLGLIQQ